jgi:hypothetical protein
MAIECSYRLASTAHSKMGDDDGNDTSGTWLMFTAVVLLAVVLILFVASASSINPVDLWPEPSLIGP